MNKFYLNFIVRLSSIAFVLITFFTIINIKDDIVWKVFCVGILIISVYLLLCALIVNFTVFEDRLVLHKPFKTINIYWKEIGLISAVEYRKNNYNFYLSPRKEVKESNFNKSVLINWQFNNHKELLDTIIRDLKNGEGPTHLVKIQDGDFRCDIIDQELMWNQLKEEILHTRLKGAENTNILELSEEYFQMANETVKAAEIYADKFATKLKNTEIILTVNVASIILLLVYQTVAAIILNHKNKELNKLAFIDINTGLPNKGCCDKFLYEHGILSSNQIDACIMFDLNNLKVVNDNFGHKAGDALIMNFANILRRTATEKVFVGRYGGDEFIAVLLDTSKEEVEALLKNIDDNIKEFSKEENGTAISYAAGYELSSDYKDCTLQILMGKADKKMYADKAEKKRNNILNKL